VPGAQQAFAEKLGLTYLLLSDVSRDTVKQYGVKYDDPNSAYFRLAKRAYIVIDQRGIVRHKEVMDHAGHLLDAETILNTVKNSVTGVQSSAWGTTQARACVSASVRRLWRVGRAAAA